MKNKIVAGILGIFLGGLGIHRFYLGQGGTGIVYLLFCWTGIPSIVGFFDGVFLLLMNDQRFDRKYNYQNGNQPGSINIYNQTPPQSFASSPGQPQFETMPKEPVPQQLSEGQRAKEEKYKELKQLHELKEQGILNDEEFELRKAQILARMEE